MTSAVGQQGRQVDQTDAEGRGPGGLQVGVVGDDGGTERGDPGGEQLTDPAEPDDADRLVGELDPGELTALPLPRPQRGVGGRNVPGHREQQREGVFGGRDDVRLRGVDHQHAAGGGRRHVDVVQPDPGPGDHLEQRRGGQCLGVHGGGRADQDGIGVGECRQQRTPIGAVDMPDLELGTEHIDRGLGELLGDQHDGLGHSRSSPWVGRSGLRSGSVTIEICRAGSVSTTIGRGSARWHDDPRRAHSARRTMLTVPGRVIHTAGGIKSASKRS